MGKLPRRVLRLQGKDLRIEPCENGLRSYCKLIPAIKKYPDAYIVTADDDYIYPRDWLAGLVNAVSPGRREVICYRAHQVGFENGRLAPFKTWGREADRNTAPHLLMAAGYGGVLYPPHVLDPRATDKESFLKLSPTGDDIWFYFMSLLNGSPVRRIDGSKGVRLPSGRIESLKAVNLADDQALHQKNVDAMVERFGFPVPPHA